MRFRNSALFFVLLLLLVIECGAFISGYRGQRKEERARDQEDQVEDEDQDNLESSDGTQSRRNWIQKNSQLQYEDEDGSQEDQIQNEYQENQKNSDEDQDQDQEDQNQNEYQEDQKNSDEDQDQDQENQDPNEPQEVQENSDENQDQSQKDQDQSADVKDEPITLAESLIYDAVSLDFPILLDSDLKSKILHTINKEGPKIIEEGKSWLEKAGRKIEEFFTGRDFDEEEAEEKSKLFHNTTEHVREILSTCLEFYTPMLKLGVKKSKLLKFCVEQVMKQRSEEIQEVENVKRKFTEFMDRCFEVVMMRNNCFNIRKKVLSEMKKEYRLNYEKFILRTGISEKIRFI